MSYCRACGHQIHETALSCPQCGAVQATGRHTPAMPAVPTPSSHGPETPPGTLWLPIPALVCSAIPLLALFDLNGWDQDQLLGSFLFITTATVLASISLAKQARGKGMAIAALVMAAIALLGTCGTRL